jgi:hypothetical protein
MADTILAAADDEASRARVEQLPHDPTRPRWAFHSKTLLPAGFGTRPDDPFLTARELAELLNVTPRWVTDKHNAGALKGGFRLPGSNRLRFDWSKVLAGFEKGDE